MAYFIPKMKWHPNAVQKIEIFFFSFFFLSLFDLHGRTSSYFLVCLNYLPLVFLHTAYVYSGNFGIVGVRSLLMVCFGEHPKARGSGLPTNLSGWALILMSFSVTLPDLWYFYWNNSLPSEFRHTADSFLHLSLCHRPACIATLILCLFFSDAFELPARGKRKQTWSLISF